MKKKLFTSLFISVVFICLLAFNASAEITVYDDAPTKLNITVTTDDIVVFNDGFSCPTGYISSDVTETSNGWNGHSTVGELFDFSYIREKTGKNYGFGDIVSVDIPQGVTYIGGYGIQGASNIEKISFPNTITGLGGWLLMGCTSLEECVFEHGENDNLTTIGPEFFANCSSLRAISFPDCITTFGWNVTYDGGYFKNCTNLGAIHLPKKLEIMYGRTDGDSVFGDLTNIYFVNESFTYDNIPSKPDVYYFPSSLAKMTGTPFKNCKNLNNVLVFGQSTTNITRGWEFEGVESGNGVRPAVVFLGDTTSINVNGWNVSAIYFANPNDVNSSTAGVSGSGTIYYCNAEGNTNHLIETIVDIPAKCEVDAVKVTYCFCGCEILTEKVTGTALSHDYDYLNGEATLVSYSYTNYLANGTKIVSCATCKENGMFVTPAFFTCVGYSVPEKGGDGIAIGYTVNNEAIIEYTTATGKILKYGVFAVLQEKLGTNDIFDEKGKASNGVINAEIDSYQYVSFELRIVGFTEKYKDTKIAIGAYTAVTEGDITVYSYMQLGTPNEGEKYCFISFNDILLGASKEENKQ